MSTFTFLHAADIHLDSPLRGLSRYEGVPADAVRAAPRAAFDALIDTAIDRRVDFVVIAGDLYDGDWRDMGTGLYFAAAMGRLARAAIPVFLITGNHDADSVITKALPTMENVVTFSTRRAETHLHPTLPVALHGRGFTDRITTENIAAAYPRRVDGRFNIGILHTSLGGYAGHATYAPCTPAELDAHRYEYWALGHVHEYQVVPAETPVVFSGNIQGRTIREAGPRGAVLVRVVDGEANFEHLVLDVVRWARVPVDATGALDRQALHDRIAASLRRAHETASDGRPLLVRLTITGRTALHDALRSDPGRLRDDVRGLAAHGASDVWIEKIAVQTEPDVPPPAIALQTSDAEFSVPAPDEALAAVLRAEFARFLAALPKSEAEPPETDDGTLDAGTLADRAAAGDWSELMQTAHAALRRHLTGGEA